MAEWRKAMGISIPGSRIVPMLSYDFGGFALDKLMAFGCDGRRLRVSPNTHWPEARHVTAILLHPRPAGWEVDLEYGVDGSRWGISIATQGPKEPLSDFVDRAIVIVNDMLEPACPGKGTILLDARMRLHDDGHGGESCEALRD